MSLSVAQVYLKSKNLKLSLSYSKKVSLDGFYKSIGIDIKTAKDSAKTE